jgi:hypothetical protein
MGWKRKKKEKSPTLTLPKREGVGSYEIFQLFFSCTFIFYLSPSPKGRGRQTACGCLSRSVQSERAFPLTFRLVPFGEVGRGFSFYLTNVTIPL